MKEDDVVQFAKALVDVKTYCHITENDPCYIVKISKEIVQLFVLWKMTKMLSQWKNESIKVYIMYYMVLFLYGWDWTRRH